MQVDWNFGAVANTFLAFFLQYGGHPIQGMPDQTAATFHIKTKVLFLLHLPFPQQRSDSDSCNRCVPAELLLPAAGVLEHTDSALSGQSHVTGKYRTASSGTPCMQHEHVLTSCPSSLFHPSGTFTPQGSLHYRMQHKEGLAVHTHPCTPFVPRNPVLMPTWGACPVAVQQSLLLCRFKVILFPTKCLSGAWGAPPCAGPGDRVTGMPHRITRVSHCSGHSTNHGLQTSAGANKSGCPQLCKALLPASMPHSEGPYSLLKDWMQKVCKTFCLLGQRRNGPTNMHLQVQNTWKKGREGGKERQQISEL